MFGSLIALIAAMALAGCGGSNGGESSSGSSTSSSSSSGSGSSESSPSTPAGAPGGFELGEEEMTCLKEQGVELPSVPQGGEGGPPEGFEGREPPSGGAGGAEMQEAFKKCGVEIPAGGPGQSGGGGVNSSAMKKSVTEYTACVRENGYDLPEPNLSGKGPIFDSSEVNQNDPKFKKANEQCQELLQIPGSGSGES